MSMEPADISAIKILANCWTLAGQDQYQYRRDGGTNRGLLYPALKARRFLTNAIWHLRNPGMPLHFKQRVYRTNRVGKPGENLWNI